jgi:hypothetical protein
VYRNVEFGRSHGYTSQQEGVTVQVEPHILLATKNARYHKEARVGDLWVLGVSIHNGSGRSLEVDPAKMSLTHASGQTGAPVVPGVAAESCRAGEATYLLHALVWGLQINGTWIPIGIPIGIWQMLIAKGSNRRMREDFRAAALERSVLPPGRDGAGLMYFYTGTKELEDGWVFEAVFNLTGQALLEVAVPVRLAQPPYPRKNRASVPPPN